MQTSSAAWPTRGVDLSGADLHGASLEEALLDGGKLVGTGCCFNGPELDTTSIDDAVLGAPAHRTGDDAVRSLPILWWAVR